MKYFENLPTISYDGSVARNIFKYLDFTEDIPDYMIQYYRIDDHESLEAISFKLYADKNFWWLLALLNEFTDVLHDVPLDSRELTAAAEDNAYQRLIVSSLGYGMLPLNSVINYLVDGVTQSATVATKGITGGSYYVDIDVLNAEPMEASSTIGFASQNVYLTDILPWSVGSLLFQNYYLFGTATLFDTAYGMLLYKSATCSYIVSETTLDIFSPSSTYSMTLFDTAVQPDSLKNTFIAGSSFDPTFVTTLSSISTTLSSNWTTAVLDKYDELEAENDDKRVIKVFNPTYKNEIIANVIRSLSNA